MVAKLEGPQFSGGANIAIKCPSHTYEQTVAFYRDTLGLTVTKQNWRAGVVFLSADPQTVDHELALMRGRPSAEDPPLIQQIADRSERSNLVNSRWR